MAERVQALISVRSVVEALAAADAGVALIDCKEPRTGALGALSVEVIAAIVAALRERGQAIEISATIGDAPRDVAAAVERVFDCGVDVVKVGAASDAMLRRLARLPQRVVPVLAADSGLDDAFLEAACDAFDTMMLDTTDKSAGSLFEQSSLARLRRIVEMVRRRGRRIGIAGALRLSELALVREVQPDFAGFRSAVCADGDRGGTLDPRRLRRLLDALNVSVAAQPA